MLNDLSVRGAVRAFSLSITTVVALTSPSLAADLGEFPDVPEVINFDETFRQAGFYAGARGGVAMVSDTSFSIAGPTLIANEYDLGYGGSGFVGYEFNDLYLGLGARVEAEVGYDLVEIDTHTVGGTLNASADSFGETTVFSGAVNVYADYNLGAFRPFLGAGLGFARVTFEEHGVTSALNVMDDSDNAFLWQASAGIAVDVGMGVTLEGMARYRSIMDVELESTGTLVPSSTDLEAIQFLGGVRFSF